MARAFVSHHCGAGSMQVPGITCSLSLLLGLLLTQRVFSPGPPVSLPQSNLTWNSGQEEPPSGMFTAESLLLLLLILLLYTCIL